METDLKIVWGCSLHFEIFCVFLGGKREGRPGQLKVLHCVFWCAANNAGSIKLTVLNSIGEIVFIN